jgi:hypothetical protein
MAEPTDRPRSRGAGAGLRRRYALGLLLVPLLLGAQGSDREAPGSFITNPGYAGNFVFTRIRYGYSGDGWGFRRGRGSWSHDYPRADQHLPRIVHEITTVAVNVEGSNVLTFDDPELFKHPVAYLSEPGFWTLTESEAANLRAYLLKGGFLIFDDFEEEQWHNFAAQLKRALPEYRLIPLDVSHPIFHCFFDMKTIDFPHPLVDVRPSYFGVFEDNDPGKRMLAIVNYNNDIAEYWEWSDTGWFPLDITNEAYKLGVNYIVYPLTH